MVPWLCPGRGLGQGQVFARRVHDVSRTLVGRRWPTRPGRDPWPPAWVALTWQSATVTWWSGERRPRPPGVARPSGPAAGDPHAQRAVVQGCVGAPGLPHRRSGAGREAQRLASGGLHFQWPTL